MFAKDKFYKDVARDTLVRQFDITKPTQKQIEGMEAILFNTWLIRMIIFDEKLTKQEKRCLYHASQGKNSQEIAQELAISANTVRTYKREIMRKLSCKTMVQAVTVGIRYGFLLTDK